MTAARVPRVIQSNLRNLRMILQGLVRRLVDPHSRYTYSGIAHNDEELYVLYRNFVQQLQKVFGHDYDISNIVIS